MKVITARRAAVVISTADRVRFNFDSVACVYEPPSIKELYMAGQYVAVFDVGKTNKKLAVYDASFSVVESAYSRFDEREDEEGIHYEDIRGITDWFLSQLKVFSGKYHIRAVSVTTHGATALCLDRHGELAVPPVAYTTEAGESFRKEFYDTFGDPVSLQELTCTAEIGSMVNIAKKLFFMKKRFPQQFKNIHTILNYPQYFGYLLTGQYGTEPTYIGCHTYLYNFHERAYSRVARELGIADALVQKISAPWDVLGTVTPRMAEKTGLSSDCLVTLGIHDSNASLLPYIVKGYKDFALDSTGTWCVGMHPTDTLGFRNNELGKLVFYFLSAYNTPVKSSIFMGGLEYETYTALINELNETTGESDVDRTVLERIMRDRKRFILPSVVKGTGIFPDARPRAIDGSEEYPLEKIRTKERVPGFFRDYETVHAVLTLSLALQTREALSMIGYTGRGSLFIEGGFRKNRMYNMLLSALYPDAEVVLTNLEEATAFGAALLGHAAVESKSPDALADRFEIKTTPLARDSLDGLTGYADEFAAKLAQQDQSG